MINESCIFILIGILPFIIAHQQPMVCLEIKVINIHYASWSVLYKEQMEGLPSFLSKFSLQRSGVWKGTTSTALPTEHNTIQNSWLIIGLCGNPVFTLRPGSRSRYCAFPTMCLQPVTTGIWKTTEKIYNPQNPEANNCFLRNNILKKFFLKEIINVRLIQFFSFENNYEGIHMTNSFIFYF